MKLFYTEREIKHFIQNKISLFSFYCLCLLYFFYKMGVSQLNNISAIYYLFYYVLQFFYNPVNQNFKHGHMYLID